MGEGWGGGGGDEWDVRVDTECVRILVWGLALREKICNWFQCCYHVQIVLCADIVPCADIVLCARHCAM